MKKVQESAVQRNLATTLLPHSRWVKMTTATIVPALFIAGGIMAAVNPSMWEVQNQDRAPDTHSQPTTPPTTTPAVVDAPKTDNKSDKNTTTSRTTVQAAHQNVVTKREAQAEKQRQQVEKTVSESKAAESITNTVDKFQERLLNDSRLLPFSLGR